MNLRNELLMEHSLEQAMRISKWALQDKKHLKELMEIFFSKEPVIAQRAAWSASKAYEMNPGCFEVYIPKLIHILSEETHGGLRRNSLRMLQSMNVPEKYHGQLIDTTFRMLSDPKEDIAVKAFAMTVAFNHLHYYPELKQEFRLIIEDQLPYASAAVKSRASKILLKL